MGRISSCRGFLCRWIDRREDGRPADRELRRLLARMDGVFEDGDVAVGASSMFGVNDL